MQTGRFARACTPAGFLGQGGFGQVYRALFGNENDKQTCAVKIIPADLRQGESIDHHVDVWSGGDVFERLKTLSSPHVLRYFDYWVEENHPLAPQQEPDNQNQDEPEHSRGPQSQMSQSLNGLIHSPTCGADDPEDGFEWEQQPKECAASDTDGSESVSRRPDEALVSKIFVFIQMECCEGITLHEWLQEPSQRDELQDAASAVAGDGNRATTKSCLGGALALARHLLEGLVALHDAQIVHRDIKPANLIVERSTGRLRILDFGLARLSSLSEDGPQKRRKKRAGVGSPGYAAPEQWSGCAAAPAADIFSAGVVLLDMFVAALRQPAGSPPWSTTMERAAVLQQLRRGTLDQPPALLGLPTRLRWLLLNMTNPNPEERPTAVDALNEVTAAFESLCSHTEA